MKLILSIVQIILSILLLTSVLLQQRGTGLGDTFGGGGGGVYRSRRGFEKTLHYFTVVVSILFVTAAIVSLFVH